MSRRKLWLAQYILAITSSLVLTACVYSSKSAALTRGGWATVVVTGGDASAQVEKYVDAVTDKGGHLLGSVSIFRVPDTGISTYVGDGVPQWVRFTWKKPIKGHATATSGVEVQTLNFAETLGDYKVQVANRIPPAVLDYANAKQGRAIRLLFRVKDDGVLLAWDVQETVKHPSGGRGLVYSLRGGDFPCDPPNAYMRSKGIDNPCTSGALRDAPWYLPVWEQTP